MSIEFTSRIHSSEFETDLYKILGKTTLEKHTSDFESINWKNNFWNEFKYGSLNMTDLEVLSKNDSKYLSISTFPNTDDTFQFFIGYGNHIETKNIDKPKRKVKIYITRTENEEIPKKLIYLFFQRDFNKINSKLKELTFMNEIEDLYKNIK